MGVPAMLLVLLSCFAAADQNSDGNTVDHAGDANTFHGDNFLHGFVGYRDNIGVRDAFSLRQKRATPSFLRAWAELLETTLGSQWVKLHGSDKVKTFVKVGTLDDAVADFKSLGPIGIKQEGATIIGRTDDTVLRLDLPSEVGRPKLSLGTSGYDAGLIYYADNAEAAQWLLRKLKNLSDLQDTNPTIH